MSLKSSRASSHVTSYIDTDVSRVREADSMTGTSECLGGADGSSHLAPDPVRLQQALVDGVLQKILVVVGHGYVSAAPSTVVTGRHLEH